MKKRILSIVVAIAMVIAMMPAMTVTASAASTGTAGGVNYSFNSSTGVLTITKGSADGSYAAGEMEDFASYSSYSKWGSGNAGKITKVIVEDGVTSIGKYAFYDLSALEEVEIASSVKSIGSYAFQSSPITSIELSEGLETIESFAFWGADFTEITIPASVKVIGFNAFEDCTALTTVKFAGEGLEYVGTYAFKECSALTDIEFPASVHQVNENVFYSTKWLTDNTVEGEYVICGSTLIDENDVVYRGTDWTVPDGIICIAGGALADTKASIVRTNDVKYVSASAASQNSDIGTVYFDNVEYIYGGFGRSSLGTVYFSENLKYIAGGSFMTSTGLKNIYVEDENSGRTFPESLEFIGSGAFYATYFLNNATNNAENGWVQVDDVLLDVTSDYEFGESFTISDDVRIIAEEALYSESESAANVTHVIVPKSVTTLAELSWFTNLQSIYYDGSKAKWENVTKLDDESWFADKTVTFSELSEFSTDIVTKYSGTYDGKAHSPKVSGLPAGAEITWSEEQNGTYTSTVPAKTNAGTYVVWYKIEGDGYETLNDSVVIVIKKKALTASNTKATLGCAAFVYNGYAKRPAVTVKMGSTVLMNKGTKDNKNIDLTYAAGRTKPGTYKVTIKGIGNYSGTLTKTFKVSMQKTALNSVTAGSKRFTAKWTKLTAKKVSGYQIRYSTYANMSNSKIVKVPGYAKTSKTVTSLKAKKKYYVQIRTYKTISGTTYYSAWSAKKTVTTKK